MIMCPSSICFCSFSYYLSFFFLFVMSKHFFEISARMPKWKSLFLLCISVYQRGQGEGITKIAGSIQPFHETKSTGNAYMLERETKLNQSFISNKGKPYVCLHGKELKQQLPLSALTPLLLFHM